jgi:hypothetical protein
MGVEINRVERRLRRDVEAISFRPAEAEVADDLGDRNASDQRAIGRVTAHAIRAGGPEIAAPIYPEAIEKIGVTVCETSVIVREQAVIDKHRAIRLHPVGVDRRQRSGHMRHPCVGHVKHPLVSR